MYDDSHRYFVQHMLSHPFIPLEKGLSFYKKCVSKDEATVEELNRFISEINRYITSHSFKIVSSKCEVSGQNFLSFINTSCDSVSKLQIEYTPVQLEFFQAVTKDILSSEDKCIESIYCLNLSNSCKLASFTIHAAESSMQRWSDDGYFVMKGEFFYLGARYIEEFTSYLVSSCKPYISICMLCSGLLVLGLTCKNCKKQIHSHCLERFTVSNNKCPRCKKPWEQGLTSDVSRADISQISTSDDED